MDKNEALKYYKEHQKKVNAYSYLLHIANFDKETISPKDGNDYHNEMVSYMYGEGFLIQSDPKYIECVMYLDKCELNNTLRREIDLAKKEIESLIKFKKEDVVEFQKACMESSDAWLEAKRKDDYSLWRPYLLKLIELSKKRALIRDEKKDAYDLYLDDYEEGMNQKTYDKFFNLIKKELLPLIQKINDKQEMIDDSFLHLYYPKDKQEKFMKEYLLKYIGFNSDWIYMGESEHPFTDGFCQNNVRITTSYNEYDITSCIFSIIHEFGHATYEHQVDKKYEGTLIGQAISSGMHESQSRFFENYMGRRKSFWVNLYDGLVKIFPENLSDVSIDDFIQAINISRSSLIRMNADELTYPIHILIRYEMEKGIFNGTIDLENLNLEWNKKYKDYLGIDVASDTYGIMQDIHWSDASFGYFPTYALGSAIGAQLLNKMEKDIDVDGLLEKNRFKEVVKYLKNNIQKYGALYNYKELLIKATGEDFNPKYYVNYLKNKYKKLYKIK